MSAVCIAEVDEGVAAPSATRRCRDVPATPVASVDMLVSTGGPRRELQATAFGAMVSIEHDRTTFTRTDIAADRFSPADLDSNTTISSSTGSHERGRQRLRIDGSAPA